MARRWDEDTKRYWPDIVRAPAMPVTIVCGPPAAGKSYYVRQRAGLRDIVIDLDDIARALGVQPRGGSPEDRQEALDERNRRLQALADGRNVPAAWFITTAPAGASRERWARLLRASSPLLILTPRDVSLARIDADAERSAYRGGQVAVLDRWWAAYYPSPRDVRVDV